MFGLSWGEIGLIMAVALIVIGPKDLPVAVRFVTAMMKKARGMAAEFQGHVDEMMREANLSEVRAEIDKIRNFDFKGAAEKHIDPDGSLRASMPAETWLSGSAGAPHAARPAAGGDGEAAAAADVPEGPAFIPPGEARKPPMPPFIPPGTRRWGN